MADTCSVFGRLLLLFHLFLIIQAQFIEDDGLGELADAFGDLFSEMTDCEFKCPGFEQGDTNVCNGHGTCQFASLKYEDYIFPGVVEKCKYDACPSGPSNSRVACLCSYSAHVTSITSDFDISFHPPFCSPATKQKQCISNIISLYMDIKSLKKQIYFALQSKRRKEYQRII